MYSTIGIKLRFTVQKLKVSFSKHTEYTASYNNTNYVEISVNLKIKKYESKRTQNSQVPLTLMQTTNTSSYLKEN